MNHTSKTSAERVKNFKIMRKFSIPFLTLASEAKSPEDSSAEPKTDYIDYFFKLSFVVLFLLTSKLILETLEPSKTDTPEPDLKFDDYDDEVDEHLNLIFDASNQESLNISRDIIWDFPDDSMPEESLLEIDSGNIDQYRVKDYHLDDTHEEVDLRMFKELVADPILAPVPPVAPTNFAFGVADEEYIAPTSVFPTIASSTVQPEKVKFLSTQDRIKLQIKNRMQNRLDVLKSRDHSKRILVSLDGGTSESKNSTRKKNQELKDLEQNHEINYDEIEELRNSTAGKVRLASSQFDP